MQDASWLAELRTATVIFVNLKDLVLDKKGNDSPALAHQILCTLQPIISNNGGYRRQYLVDDKGSVLIVVFGVPPFAHSDDPYRAVKTAIEMRNALGMCLCVCPPSACFCLLHSLHATAPAQRISFDLCCAVVWLAVCVSSDDQSRRFVGCGDGQCVRRIRRFAVPPRTRSGG